MPFHRGSMTRGGQEPVIGTLSPAELVDDQPAPLLRGVSPKTQPLGALHGDHEEKVRLLGRSLGALIREDSSDAIMPALGTDSLVIPATTPAALDLWAEGHRSSPAAPQHQGSWLSFRRLLDLVGMSLAFLLFWIAYRGFVALPQAPAQSPWTRLGSARLEAAPATNAAVASTPGKNLPPIGQFDFGQFTPPEALPALGQQQPVELYRSIYELEDAFEAKYVPPPACAGLEENNAADLTDCVNHRLRARRAFLASNGRSMTPDDGSMVRRPGPGWEVESGEPWR